MTQKLKLPKKVLLRPAWLYQMSAPTRQYYPQDFQDEVCEGRQLNWSTGRNYYYGPNGKVEISTGDVSKGDTVILFFCKNGIDKPGIYGWGTITKAPNRSGDNIEFLVRPPSDLLKDRPLWDPEVQQLMNEIRQGMYSATMWSLTRVQLQKLYKKLQKHIGIASPGSPAPVPRTPQKKSVQSPRQSDPDKRRKVEEAAIELTRTYYENLGYTVDSVEKDNAGWDLEASQGQKLLRLEVKGLSQQKLLIELTPNEYKQMKQHQKSYTICIVTDALGKNKALRIFSYSSKNRRWEDKAGNQLEVSELVGARLTVS